MWILTAEQAAAVDRRTIDEVGVPGRVLMETAGRAVLQVVLAELEAGRAGDGVVVLAGPGNNGGDGFVVARGLAARGIPCRVGFVGALDRLRGDAAIMHALLVRCAPGVPVVAVAEPGEVEACLGPRPAVVVDALFGTGLARPLGGVAARVVEAVNAWGARVVAVDIPSGVNGSTGEVPGVAIRADVTVAIGYLKRGLVLYPGADHCGDIRVAEIGFPPDLAEAEGDGVEMLEPERAAAWLPVRPTTAHKGSAGKVLVVAGSMGMTGAALLAARGGLRSGAGLVVLGVPERVAQPLQGEVWEALSLPLPDDGRGCLGPASLDAALAAAETADALAVGPGVGRREETLALVSELIERVRCPVVVDADGLRALAERPRASAHVVVTPHPGEMSTLLGRERARITADPIAAARECARRYGVTALLKGAHTVVSSREGRVTVNPTGNSGMASGGMGDVLTGLLAGFMAQGMESFRAASAAALVHGLAGDRVAACIGARGFLARDVAEALPGAVEVLRQSPRSVPCPRCF